MKTLLCILAGTMLTSFAGKQTNEDDLDGFWMGYYRSDVTKEKVIIKLNDDLRMDFYTGGLDEKTRVEGSYQIFGEDSVAFTYTTADGEKIQMQGHYNRRRNFIDGICRTNDLPSGSFYLEKQELEERMVKP